MTEFKTKIKLKRVYDISDRENRFKVLVDRLWPRGLTKEKLKIDLWEKKLAPSNELRKWYHDNLEKWDDFREKYIMELKLNQASLREFIGKIDKEEEVLFLYGSKNEKANHAVILKEFLELNFKV
ncbi:DUF488 domain-containing protein [Xanthovirga aplysinae]|uniref:DUF488 domain-containing protein n=1 Tax=Xanthovirga aplysinae TaxID=2529853 RepID=UPI0012BCBF88|nr:DUF488 family protein [Xanthovirga aplysinae]MTI32153.1 DUF488 family protein [Xanthovirga aplysinae]